jgi:hypothetical protein
MITPTNLIAVQRQFRANPRKKERKPLMKKLILLGLALVLSSSDGRLPAGEPQTLAARTFAASAEETAAAIAPANVAFVVRSYGGKCLDFGPPPQVVGSPVFISRCNAGSSTQQIVVEEINDRHEVILHAGNKVIAIRGNPPSTLPGTAAPVSGVLPDSETPVELQNETNRLTSPSTRQIFALDGDSMILVANRNLVIKVQNNRGADRTPLVFGRRELADSEFWTFTAPNDPNARPTRGFVRVSQVNDFDGGTQANSDFVNAVLNARWGTVIELDPGVSLDLRDLAPIFIEAGVTIRGDRRGTNPGPLLAALNRHDQAATSFKPDIDGGMLFINGDHVRITGLRMQGPSRRIQPDLPYANGIAALDQFISIIDHNEMFDWTAAAVYTHGETAGDDVIVTDHRDPSARPTNIRVLRNFIHDNQRWGEGYGVVTYSANPAIEGNTFLSNRHAIAANKHGFSGYTARFNLVLSASPDYHSLPGSPSRTPDFDMHGTLMNVCADYCGGAAGWYCRILRNTFLGTNRANFVLRGTPGFLAEFRNNISLQNSADALLIHGNDGKKLGHSGNQFSAPNPTAHLGVGDFDGDGTDDLFLATGAAWYYAPAGSVEWRFLNAQTDGIDSLRFGDFDGDGRTDVFTQHAFEWDVSWGGASNWEKINVSAERLNDFVVGNFDDKPGADIFYADGHEWSISSGGVGPFEHFAFSVFRVSALRFGDFNRDGKTDVFGVGQDDWRVVFAGTDTWSPLRPRLTTSVNGLMVADFNGDGRADVAGPKLAGQPNNLFVSDGGVGDFTKLRVVAPGALAAIGRFDSHAGVDMLLWHDNALDITSGLGSPRNHNRNDMR